MLASLRADVARATLVGMAVSSTSGARRRTSHPDRAGVPDRSWARWHSAPETYTVGIEEETILVDARTHRPAYRADAALAAFSEALRARTAPETHACVLELRTDAHARVAGALRELRQTREALSAELAPLGLRAAVAGTHALASAREHSNSEAARYREVSETMRSLAHREPTMALHVHVAVEQAEHGVRVLNRLRENIPALIALAANSPFVNGVDTGFASARTPIFGAFPRTGTPRSFRSYADWVESIDALVAPGAIPDHTFLWWDVRLQPTLGTVEVRAMDAQTAVEDAAPLIALVQSLARLELEGEPGDHRSAPELLEENRFRAARDGVEAQLIDPQMRRLVPVRAIVERLVEECRPHATALRCASALENLDLRLSANGAHRQRACASRHGVAAVVPALAEQFVRRPAHELA
jgi:glutamate---cysteine ligase / carboxylate-amine ligase